VNRWPLQLNIAGFLNFHFVQMHQKKKPDKFACRCSLENYSYCRKL